MTLLPLPDLPAVLVSPAAADALAALIGRFVAPAGILIECPLGDAAATADVSVSCARPPRDGESRIVSGEWPAGPAWDRVRRFAEVWRDPAGPLGRDVRSLWLEFDLRRGEAAPLPNPFFGHSDGIHSRATLLAGLDLLLDADASAARTPALDTLAALPPAANVVFVGAMLARQPPAIRFCVDGPPWFDAPPDLIRRARHVIVQLEAGTPLAARVGYELYQGRRQRGRSDVWRALLGWLMECGVARADRAAAALQWPGYAFCGSHVVARWISHVKVTCEGDAIVEAKVYLQCAPAWEPAASDAAGLAG